MTAIAEFAHKLGLVLKACNLSRARLAQTVGIDKSVVSRWASGVQTPTDHNLTLLTEAIGRHRPGFARIDWELASEDFAERLGLVGGASEGESGLALPTRPSIDEDGRVARLRWLSKPGQTDHGLASALLGYRLLELDVSENASRALPDSINASSPVNLTTRPPRALRGCPSERAAQTGSDRSGGRGGLLAADGRDKSGTIARLRCMRTSGKESGAPVCAKVRIPV